MRERLKALSIYVAGRVQGVGFRPFIHRIALEAGVSGYVRNMGGGEVEIWVEGGSREVQRFLKLLREQIPPPAEVERLEVREAEPNGYREFTILRSGSRHIIASSLPPDLGVCEHCLREVLDPTSRWYRYPFNSCAWCGPRYSMMYRSPYDRENTSMRRFPLCSKCSREYRDIGNRRRYHAQGISCPSCGPSLSLWDGDLKPLESRDPIREAARLIEEEMILAVKGLGGFHLACLASSDEAVLELRRRKKRRSKPFALMALDLETAGRIVELTPEAEKLLRSSMRPIVLLPRREGAPVSRWVAPGLQTLGVMLPYTPLHYLLLAETRDRFLIMTSGNLGGDPMIRDERLLGNLRGVADAYLVHNREIVHRVDDPVVKPTHGGWTMLRCGRGYAPAMLHLPFTLEESYAALGAELQTAPAIGFDETIVLAPYSGDTDNPLVLREHLESLEFLLESYGLLERDGVVAADLHPLYMSRRAGERLSRRLGWRLRLIQHHYAHIASAMAEHRHPPEEPAVGIAVDGVGYGLDGAVWGGEIIEWGSKGFQRRGRLEYHPMPGGDLAVLRPLRMLASILSSFLDPQEIERLFERYGLLTKLPRGVTELRAVVKLAERGSPLTSSTGRFLDSVSALLGVCFERSYEGEPAIMLEDYARGGNPLRKDVDELLGRKHGLTVVSTSRLMELLLQLLDTKASRRDVAYTAQYLLGKALGAAAGEVMLEAGAEKLYISGGAAVNEIILRGVAEGAETKPLLNRRIPANDGGIAVGQIYASALLEGGVRLGGDTASP